MKTHYITAAAALLLTISVAHAEDLKPVQAQAIDLGEVSGIGYYTVAADGFHVVATLAHGAEDKAPLRVRAVLAAGQAVTFSTPGSANTEPTSISIARQGDRLVVLRSANPSAQPTD